MITEHLDISKVKNILPHRHPCLMVDKILQIESRKYIVCLKNVSIGEPYFQGHFSDNPIMPGTLILESLLQSGAALFLQDPEFFGRYAFFASMNNVQFFHKVLPGDQLRLEMEVSSSNDTVIYMTGRALVDGKVVCSGDFSFNLALRPNKPQIHATASVHHTAVLGRNIVIGANTKWTKIGTYCNIHFGCVIGSGPQDMKYSGEKSWVSIGDNNEIREYVTINRATGENNITTIGSDNIFLTHVHIAHNCILGNNIIIANTTNLGGHTEVQDKAVIGGMTGIHQFVRIGKAAMVGAYTRLPQDVPPFMLCEGNPAVIRGLNAVGLRRNNIAKMAIKEIKSIYKLLYRSELDTASSLNKIKNQPFESIEAKHLIDFVINSTSRGFTKKQASDSHQ